MCLVQIWRYQWDEGFTVLLEKTCLGGKTGPYPGISHTILAKREVLQSTSGGSGTLLLGSELWPTCSCAGGSFNVQGSIGKTLMKKVLLKFSVISEIIADPKFSASFFVLDWSCQVLCPGWIYIFLQFTPCKNHWGYNYQLEGNKTQSMATNQTRTRIFQATIHVNVSLERAEWKPYILKAPAQQSLTLVPFAGVPCTWPVSAGNISLKTG